jgi:hypothetical protein
MTPGRFRTGARYAPSSRTGCLLPSRHSRHARGLLGRGRENNGESNVAQRDASLCRSTLTDATRNRMTVAHKMARRTGRRELTR